MKFELESNSVLSSERAVNAYIGAASGDALGWPFEGHSSKKPSIDEWDGNFIEWDKRSGGRFRPYLEHIEAGEYSDDTQLILALTRSRLKSRSWWKFFAECELPFWTFYERGGGGATKRAAASWLTSIPPWKATREDNVKKYLAAGGNGVAMRVLPHCIAGVKEENFEAIARDIMSDGVITHGHPRALVGALAYGFALWYALKLKRTLNFGELVDAAIENVNAWSELPSIDDRWEGWGSAVGNIVNYVETWHSTCQEMLILLKSIRNGIQAGALARDEDVLDSIGARSIKTNGAGTVSAAAAIYFSSRYAASPFEGLRRSACAIGTDTDTIASMTGAILGSITNNNWLKDLKLKLQDFEYIEKIARHLAKGDEPKKEEFYPVRRTEINKIGKALNQIKNLDDFPLPNGMKIKIANINKFDKNKSDKRYPLYWKIITMDGMTLFSKLNDSVSEKNLANDVGIKKEECEDRIALEISQESFIGISLVVASLENSQAFYQNILNMAVSGRTPKTLRFGSYLAFREEPLYMQQSHPITIFLEVENPEILYRRLKNFDYPNVGDIVDKAHRKSFTCADPDGYTVEIVERKK